MQIRRWFHGAEVVREGGGDLVLFLICPVGYDCEEQNEDLTIALAVSPFGLSVRCQDPLSYPGIASPVFSITLGSLPP